MKATSWLTRCYSLVLAIAATLLLSSLASAVEWWVAPNGTGNGSSQGSPSGDLQAMINGANAAGGDVINIAAGTYKPHATNRLISFEISGKNVSLRGGWTLGTPWTPSTDPTLTILSGNINNTNIATDNSYTVLKLSYSGAVPSGPTPTVISFLTITGGFANDGAGQDSGGGVRITNGAAPRLDRCRIIGNFAGTSANSSINRQLAESA